MFDSIIRRTISKQVDRTQLSGDFCYSDSGSQDQIFGSKLPYSKVNCEVFLPADTNSSCSMSQYYGISQSIDAKSRKSALQLQESNSNNIFFSVNSLRPCEPKDIIEKPLSYNLYESRLRKRLIEECLPHCMTTEYLFELSEGTVKPESVRSW